MATAFNISRLLAAGAARGAPRAASVGSRNLLPAASTFGASLPGGRQLGDGRVFAFPNGNGSGARGAHTATAAAPRGGSSSASGSSPSGGAKSHATHGAHETKAKEKSGSVPSELVFEPFEEVAGALEEVRSSEGHDVSLAREASYTAELEEAVNAQISVELTIRRVVRRARAARARRQLAACRALARDAKPHRGARIAPQLTAPPPTCCHARSHIYHSMYAYFDRDNVSLRGLAAYFLKQSDGERRHAENFMQFQNRRGGRVRLTQLPMPMSDFDHAEKGDALNVRWQLCFAPSSQFRLCLGDAGAAVCAGHGDGAVTREAELPEAHAPGQARRRSGRCGLRVCAQLYAARLRRGLSGGLPFSLRFVDLRGDADLHAVARVADFNLADYVDEMIDDQTKDVKCAADYVSQLRRVGKGHGTWDWDQELYDEYH
jgi:ferritin